MLPADRKAPKVPCLNESPSQKEGKCCPLTVRRRSWRLNESPSQKEGKLQTVLSTRGFSRASMKVPPKRKENAT